MKKRVNSDNVMDTTDLFILSKIRNTSFQTIVTDLVTNRVNLNEYKLLHKIKDQVSKGYPLAYILERIEFLNREFYLNKNVLIPRPETEEWVSNFIKNFKLTRLKTLDQKYNLLDMATGSGVIGISAWLELGLFLDQVFLVDLSHQALEVAQINYNYFKQNYTSKSNITIKKSDLFSDFSATELSVFQNPDNHNIFVANLPYLPDLDQSNLPNLAFEPQIALFSGEDGLGLFTQTLEQIIDLDLKFDTLYFELDPRNIFQAQAMLGKYKYFSNFKAKILIDFMGKSRVLILDIL